jgi:uncharacterized membrane protein
MGTSAWPGRHVLILRTFYERFNTIQSYAGDFLMLSRITIIALIVCSLFIAGVIGYNDYHKLNQVYFVTDLETSASGGSQVFYDIGDGYNEADSCIIVVQRGSSQNRMFSLLPSKAIRSIRFDPINVPAEVRIKNARVENKQGDIVKKLPIQDFRPVQQIAKMYAQDDTLVIHTVKNANDPIIQIENSSIKNQINWNDYIAKRGWIIIGYGLLSLLILIGLNYLVIFAVRHEYIISKVSQHREAALAGLLGLWGLTLLILTPPLQVPDELAHFDRSFQVSEFTMMAAKQGDLSGGTLPQILKVDQAKFNFLPFSAERKLSRSQYFTIRKESPAMNPENLKKREFYYFPNTTLYPPVPYLFSGLGIAIARFFSMTVLDGFYMARLFNLLAAIGLIYGAMHLLRRLPELQLMLFLIAGMPMTAFELMSVSADCITFSFAVLVFACIVNLSLKWNRRVYVLLVASCVLLGLCKQVYAFLPLVSFIFWRSIPRSSFRKTGCVMLVIASSLVPMVVWSMLVKSIYVSPIKGIHIEPVEQMRYFIDNWHTLIPYFIKDIFYNNLRSYGYSMYGLLGWLDTPLPCKNAVLYICLCFASVLLLIRRKALPQALNCRGDNGLVMSIATRTLLLSIVLVSVFIIVLSLYLSWNPVGALSLEGIQGRYFIPLLPFGLLAFYRLLPIRLTRPCYLYWVVFCLGAWAYFSWQTASILCIRYWIA